MFSRLSGRTVSGVLAGAVLLAAGWMFLEFNGHRGRGSETRVFAAGRVTPYYIHQTNYTHRADGSVVLTSYSTLARRSDGAMVERTEALTPEGKVLNSTRRFFFPGGVVVDTEDLAGLVTVMRLPGGEARHTQSQLDPAAQCAKTFGGGGLPAWAQITEERLLGYATFKATVDGPKARSEVWRAPELGCAIVKQILGLKDQSGQVTRWAEATADTIHVAEPPGDPFVIPATFRNVPPSERVKGNPLNVSHEVPESVRADDDLFAKYRASLP